MRHSETTVDVYSLITEKIMAHLQAGTVPWRKPWNDAGIPMNYVSKKPYRGINLWLLNAAGFSRNIFLTYNQAKEAGATVKKDAKGQLVVFWKWIKKDAADPRPITELTSQDLRPILRYYVVFNVEQCSGLPMNHLPTVQRANEPLLSCEAILDAMPSPPEIRHEIHKACYFPKADLINMPKIETFESSELYYSTLFHELVHSTGHSKRLNRKELISHDPFGSEDYSIEELTAELGASYLDAHAGIVIDDFSNNAAYIDGWLKELRNDKRLIIYASAQAQRAVDFILNQTYELD